MPNEALIVVDVQNDFCERGALAVTGAHAIVPLVNRLIARHEHVVLTQDWHPPGHASFASAWQDAEPFTTVQFPYGAIDLDDSRKRMMSDMRRAGINLNATA
jgi:nicotinamidase/pyrazinamidase